MRQARKEQRTSSSSSLSLILMVAAWLAVFILTAYFVDDVDAQLDDPEPKQLIADNAAFEDSIAAAARDKVEYKKLKKELKEQKKLRKEAKALLKELKIRKELEKKKGISLPLVAVDPSLVEERARPTVERGTVPRQADLR